MSRQTNYNFDLQRAPVSAKKYHKLSDQACAKMELAVTYMLDGAPRSAAACLRAAADLLMEAAETRDKALDR